MRTKGYKCYNIECGSCIAKTLCGEPADAALGCQNRMVAAEKERHTRWISFRGKKHPTIEEGEKHLKAAIRCLAILEDKLGRGDVVEVVRCKDCIYSADAKENGKGFLVCPASGMEIMDIDFCSHGERRGEDGALNNP